MSEINSPQMIEYYHEYGERLDQIISDNAILVIPHMKDYISSSRHEAAYRLA